LNKKFINAPIGTNKKTINYFKRSNGIDFNLTINLNFNPMKMEIFCVCIEEITVQMRRKHPRSLLRIPTRMMKLYEQASERASLGSLARGASAFN